VDVPPKRVPYFKPGKELKDLINRVPPAAEAGPSVATGPAPAPEAEAGTPGAGQG
jgi:hypothetical protein